MPGLAPVGAQGTSRAPLRQTHHGRVAGPRVPPMHYPGQATPAPGLVAIKLETKNPVRIVENVAPHHRSGVLLHADPQSLRAPIDTQRVMEKITADQQGAPPPPADFNRNGRPTSIAMGGRHQLECPADIVGIRRKR